MATVLGTSPADDFAAGGSLVGLDTLAHNWWAVALRGVAGVLLGIFTFLVPGVTLAVLILAFGVYALISGALDIVAALRQRSAGVGARWGMLFVAGIAGIVFGALTLWFPGVTTLFLLYLIAGWALITGIAEIVAAIRLRKAIRGEWLLALSGLLSVLFGVILVVAPGAGAIALTFWVGAYALAAGIVLLVLAFRLRRYSTATVAR